MATILLQNSRHVLLFVMYPSLNRTYIQILSCAMVIRYWNFIEEMLQKSKCAVMVCFEPVGGAAGVGDRHNS